MSLGHSESGFVNKQYNLWTTSKWLGKIYIEPSEIRRGGNGIFLTGILLTSRTPGRKPNEDGYLYPFFDLNEPISSVRRFTPANGMAL